MEDSTTRKPSIRSGSKDISFWCESCSAKDGRTVATWDVGEYYINLCRSCLLEAVAEIDKVPTISVEPK